MIYNQITEKPSTLASLWQMVGNTPLIEIGYAYKGGPEQHLLIKCEHYNLTGSIKDRMALYILEKAYELGQIQPGDTIVEATSGNTGIAFAAIGKALGHKVRIIMPDWLSQERIDIVKSLGAEIVLVSAEAGGFTESIRLAEEMYQQGGVFLPRQFENRFNVEAHEKTTGREIGQVLLLTHRMPDAFVAGVGTGGTVMGTGNCLRGRFAQIRVHPLEPAESPTLSTGTKIGTHRIQGISDEFIPSIVDLSSLDEIIQIHDGDAILMAQKLGKESGLAVGLSSGANFLGAVKVQQQLGPGSTVITIFPDSNKKYLSTALFREEPIKDHYLSPEIRLTSYHALMR